MSDYYYDVKEGEVYHYTGVFDETEFRIYLIIDITENKLPRAIVTNYDGSFKIRAIGGLNKNNTVKI